MQDNQEPNSTDLGDLTENTTAAEKDRPLIEVRLMCSQASMPYYATPGSAGMDLSAVLPDGPLAIPPGQNRLIQTGVAFHIKDPNLVGVLASRSGHGLKHRVRLGNGIGIIDSDYQREICVILYNDGELCFDVEHGERIAQLMIMPVRQAKLMLVEEFSGTTERTDGFGSTGK